MKQLNNGVPKPQNDTTGKLAPHLKSLTVQPNKKQTIMEVMQKAQASKNKHKSKTGFHLDFEKHKRRIDQDLVGPNSLEIAMDIMNIVLENVGDCATTQY